MKLNTKCFGNYSWACNSVIQMQCSTGAFGNKGYREMHTALGLQNSLSFTSTFSHLMIALLLKRHVPSLAPAMLPQYTSHPGWLANCISRLIWTKNNPTKMLIIFRWVLDLAAGPRDTGVRDGVVSPLLVAARSSAGQADKETSGALRACYKVHVIWRVLAVTSDLFSCMWNHGFSSNFFRWKTRKLFRRFFGRYLRRCCSSSFTEVQHQCLLWLYRP